MFRFTLSLSSQFVYELKIKHVIHQEISYSLSIIMRFIFSLAFDSFFVWLHFLFERFDHIVV